MMKKFILHIILFCVLLVCCDVVLGSGFRYLIAHAKGGDTGLNNLINNEMRADILFMGSSRARYHYAPSVFEDTLGLSAFNCGRSGNGIILMYGVYKMISERYTPKVILYEVTPMYDFLSIDNHTFLPYLRYYYDRQGVDSLFWDIDPTERIKMLSNIYRCNMDVPQLVLDNLRSLDAESKGFVPLEGEMGYDPAEEEELPSGCDDKKIKYIEKLINDCQGKTQLVFLASPAYRAESDQAFEPIRDIAAKHNIPFINHYCDTTFTTHKAYFYNPDHMNRRGAEAYSKVVAGEVRSLLAAEE